MNATESEFPNPKAADVIREFAVKSGFKNVKLSVKPGSAKGDNFVGIVFRVKIEGFKNNKHEELDVIVKAAPVAEDSRQMLPLRDLFLREIFVYTQLFPVYEKLQSAVNIEKSDMYRFPDCYTVNTEQLNEFLVMQDLSIQSYVMHEPKTELLDFKHAAIILKTLARYHGLSYVLQARKPMLFYELVSKMPELFTNLEEPFQPIVKYFELASMKALTAIKGEPEYEIFERFAKDTFRNLGKLIKPQKYAVICHGDYWKNNILIKYLSNKRPATVIPLDYQMVRYSSPVTDILYFMFLCTSQQLRNERYTDLLEAYHESLEDYLAYYNLKVEDVFPREELNKEMVRVGGFGLGMSICVLIFMTTSGEELADATSAMNDNVNEDSPGFKLYKERMLGVVQDCIKFGYIK